MKKTLILVLCITFLLPLHGLSQAFSFLQDYDAIEKASDSVLFIEVYNHGKDLIGTGSGFLAFNNQTFITNYHVIENSTNIKIYDEDFNEYLFGEVLVVDEEKDIAIIGLKYPAKGLTPLSVNKDVVLKRGQPVAAIGSPQGFVNTFSTGIISSIYNLNSIKIIQFTAPISPGSSGGALFDDQGEVIGITSAYMEDAQNINIAVGIEHAVEMYNDYLNRPVATISTFSTSTQLPSATPFSVVPKLYKAEIILDAVVIKWGNSVVFDGYRVYRSYVKQRGYEELGVVKGTEFTDRTVEAGKVYYYQIEGIISKSGTLSRSEVLRVEVPYYQAAITPSAKPTLKPTPTATTAPTPKPTPTPSPRPIDQIDPSEFSKYRILTVGSKGSDVARLKQRMFELGYFKSNTVNETFTETTAEYVKQFQTANGLFVDGIATPEMQALFFSEYAIAKQSTSGIPNPTLAPKPAKPKNLKTSLSGTTSVTLIWASVSGVQTYQVFRSLSEKGEYKLIAADVKVNSYTDRGLTSGKTYYYKVKSVSGEQTSDFSDRVKASVPKPSPTPAPEPKYPIVIGDYGYYGTTSNPYLNPKITNVSRAKTVDGFTLTYYCENIYGDTLYFNKTKDKYSEYTYIKTISPGKSVYPGKVSLSLYEGTIKYIHVAITKIHTTDGKTYSIPESDWDFYYWTLDK